MPELPEVETVRRDLEKYLLQEKIKRVEVFGVKGIFPTPQKFIQNVRGRVVRSIKRYGKLLVFELSGERFLLVHLKMTGQLVFQGKKEIIAGGHPIQGLRELPNKYTRFIFEFLGDKKLYFNDTRRFGYAKLLTHVQAAPLLREYGIDPTSPDFTQDVFLELLRPRKRVGLKHFLLRQKPISGLGNIYVDETCFLAKVRPTRLIGSLTLKEKKALWSAMRKILELSLKNRGTSFNTYVDADGRAGTFRRYLKVYGRKKEKCLRCGGEVKYIRLTGRGTHFCSSCQR